MDKTRYSAQVPKSNGVHGCDFLRKCLPLRSKPGNQFKSSNQTLFNQEANSNVAFDED